MYRLEYREKTEIISGNSNNMRRNSEMTKKSFPYTIKREENVNGEVERFNF